MNIKLTHRTFLKTIGVSSVTLGMPRCLNLTSKKRHPNIIFIITDQQHAGMMNCTGNPYLKTPAMDRLAASGIRFEMAYTANPVCLPARFSFFSGRMPSSVGIGFN